MSVLKKSVWRPMMDWHLIHSVFRHSLIFRNVFVEEHLCAPVAGVCWKMWVLDGLNLCVVLVEGHECAGQKMLGVCPEKCLRLSTGKRKRWRQCVGQCWSVGKYAGVCWGMLVPLDIR